MKTALKIQTFAIAALIGLALANSHSARAADQLAMTSPRPIAAFSTIFKLLESRPDYGVFQAVRYETDQRAYDFRYTADDGTTKEVEIDAVTGREVNTLAGDVARR